MEPTRLRLDKWLWHARFFRSRSLASQFCLSGKARVNGQRIDKPSTLVGPGDVLTFVRRGTVFVVEVLALGDRRGPSSEAQTLYREVPEAPEN